MFLSANCSQWSPKTKEAGEETMEKSESAMFHRGEHDEQKNSNLSDLTHLRDFASSSESKWFGTKKNAQGSIEIFPAYLTVKERVVWAPQLTHCSSFFRVPGKDNLVRKGSTPQPSSFWTCPFANKSKTLFHGLPQSLEEIVQAAMEQHGTPSASIFGWLATSAGVVVFFDKNSTFFVPHEATQALLQKKIRQHC